ncbi:Brp/Blh family beta-carotene 15,15'-dioxygenase [Streptomyces phyllanthi]|uniref:Brp/Blh family beta-carotene 15,15'-dioxygenase n=1 Tax=Streptomyces phyllanthi TaxID=1803180 RepID=UPI0018841984|nr:Brp/Blh family beta-carotene 15,15'-dioxygenase [Streptomyces phyllanthi]
MSAAVPVPARGPSSQRPLPVLLGQVTWLSLAVVTLAVAVYLAVPTLRGGHDLPELAVLALLFGTPHGTVDHLLPQSGEGPLHGRALVRTVGLHLAGVAVITAATLVMPVIGLGLVIAVSAVHFGSSDAALARERRGLPPRWGTVAVLAYGGPLAFVSFARWPEHVRRLFEVISPGLARELRGPILVAAAATLVAVCLFVVGAVRRRQWLDAVEVSALLALVLVLPPLAAFGVYFAAWHSLRQYVRLYADARGTPSPFTAADLVRTMAVATAATVVLGAVAVVLLRAKSEALLHFGPGDWLIVLLAAVIVPHTIAVLRYDRWKAAHTSDI